jgi:hypothetical protein
MYPSRIAAVTAKPGGAKTISGSQYGIRSTCATSPPSAAFARGREFANRDRRVHGWLLRKLVNGEVSASARRVFPPPYRRSWPTL